MMLISAKIVVDNHGNMCVLETLVHNTINRDPLSDDWMVNYGGLPSLNEQIKAVLGNLGKQEGTVEQ